MARFITDEGDSIYIASDISITMISPLFEKKNTYTFSFAIPSTPENDILFDRAALIDARDNKIRTIDGALIAYILKFIGQLKVLKYSGINYQCSFIGQGAAYSKLNALKMNKLDIGNGDFFVLQGIKSVYSDHIAKIGNEYAYCFPPMLNEKYTENYPFVLPYTAIPVINYFFVNVNYYNIYTLKIPAFFVKWIIKKILNLKGFYITENALDDSTYEGLLLYSNRTDIYYTFVDHPSYIYTFSSITIDDSEVKLNITSGNFAFLYKYVFVKLYDISNNNYNDRIVQVIEIDIDEDQVTINVDPSTVSTSLAGKIILVSLQINFPNTFNIAPHMPDMEFTGFLEEIEKITATKFIFDESRNSVRIIRFKDVVNSKEFIDITQFASSPVNKEMNTNDGYLLKFDPVADDYWKDHVNELREEHTLETPVAALNNLPMSENKHNDVRLVTNLNQLYIWDVSDWGSRQVIIPPGFDLGSWRFFGEYYIGLKEGNEDLDYTINAGPLLPSQGNSYTANNPLLRINIPINTEFVKENSDPGIRLMFFSELTGGYPLAKDENDYMKLSIRGENGLYEKFYKYILEFLLNRAREETRIIQWPLKLLNSFRWEDKYRVGSTNYLVKKIEFTVKKNDFIEFGETTLVRT